MWNWRRRSDRDFADEIAANLALHVDRLVETGMKPEDAQAAARRAFGNVTRARELRYDSQRILWLDDLSKDLKHAVRMLRRNPVFSILAIVTLGVGIGANTAIFSVVNSLVLQSLPVSASRRLMALSTGERGTAARQFSYATLTEIRRRVDVLDGVAGYTTCCGKSTVTDSAGLHMVDRQWVTGDFFDLLGVRAARGRLLTADDNERTAREGPVGVVSYRYWRVHLNGRDDAVGRPLRIDGTLVTIVGVTPAEFFGVEVGRTVDLFLPERLAGLLSHSPFNDDNAWLNILVRVKPGVSAADANALLRAAQPAIRAASAPKSFTGPLFLADPLTLEPAAAGLSAVRERLERPAFVLFGVAALVLLMACINIAHLLLARSAGRHHELSVRVALGASRGRLARHLFAESLLLAVCGTVVGLAFAPWTAQALLAHLSTARDPISLQAAVDWRVLAFSLAATGATVLLCGTAPAFRMAATGPMDVLKAAGSAGRGGRRPSVLNSLIVIQVSVSLVLVVAAGLLVQTFDRLTRRSLGFEPGRTIVVNVTAPTIAAENRPAFFFRLADSVRSVPGVVAAGGALNPPVVGGLGGIDVVISTPGTVPATSAERIPQFDSITPGWFAAYGIQIERGRDFDARDTARTPPVMIVNATFVRRLFPDQDVVGRPLSLAWVIAGGYYPYGVRTIVGVAADSVYQDIRRPVGPMIYVPLAQREPIPQKDLYLGVRSAGGSPALLERSLAAAITAFNQDLGFEFQALGRQVDESMVNERVMAMLSAGVGGLAMLLAGLGLHGLIAHDVSRRRHEIGIRIALGASAAGVVRLVLLHVSVLVGAGLLIGAVVSRWASQLLASLLYGIEPRDPVTLIGAMLVLAWVGALAGWVPVSRATKVDPMIALRSE
jgi:predicted permease